MTPLVSVVFPVGDREAYLREAVESILSQTLTQFEFLIVEDGVGVPVAKILDEFQDPRIRRIRLPIPMGIGTARNAALLAAKAPYLALMDSDDVALPHRLATQYEWMQSHPEVTVCGSNAIKVFSDGRRVNMRYPGTGALIMSRLLLVDSAIINPTAILRADFIRRHSLRYDAGFRRDEDYRFFVEILRHGGTFHNLPEQLLLYRRHAANITNDQTDFDKLKTTVRELLMSEFFPDLTAAEVRPLLKTFHQQMRMGLDEACLCLAALNHALKEDRSILGEDRAELKKILNHCRTRVVRMFQSTRPGPGPDDGNGVRG